MRKLGIIGGTSWHSTALYYDHINRGVAHRLGGLHSARLAIESLDLAPVAEMELSGDWDGVAKVMIDSATRLQASGAEGLLITSNTGHKCYDAVAANVDVPVLHIGDAVAERLVADRQSRVALLGTRFTMTEPHVRSRLEGRGINLMPIDQESMREVDRIIFDELTLGRVEERSRATYAGIIDGLAAAGSEALVLGCTEIELLIGPEDSPIPLLDSMRTHAEAAAAFALDEDRQGCAPAATAPIDPFNALVQHGVRP